MPGSSNLIAIPCDGLSSPSAEHREQKRAIGFEPFGTVLKRLRRRRGLTLAHVADALGVSKPSVWAWENGKCRPHPERIASIAALLGAQPDELSDASLPCHDPADVIEDCRRRIAGVLGTDSRSVRIIVEL